MIIGSMIIYGNGQRLGMGLEIQMKAEHHSVLGCEVKLFFPRI